MSTTFELQAKSRTEFGKGASRRLRRLADQVPGIVYGTGKEAEAISLDHKQLIKELGSEAFYSSILTLNVEGKKQKVVLKAIQRHPSRVQILHMDFLRVSATEKLTMSVPLHFLNANTAPGVKVGGGVVTQQLTEIEISCLPADLPEFIEVDLAELELDASLHVSNIKLPKGVELAQVIENADQDHPVVSISVPKVVEEPEASAEDGQAAAESGDDAGSNEEKPDQGNEE